MRRRALFIGALALLTLAADQATKLQARHALRGQPTVEVIPGYLDLEYHQNPGSAFGLLRDVPGARYILIGVGALALYVVWRMVRDVQHRQKMADVAFGLVAGGALGNVLDRIYLGEVVDFIVMHFHRRYVWPAYNVADVALVVGVGLLLLVLGRRPEPARPGGRKQRKKKKKR